MCLCSLLAQRSPQESLEKAVDMAQKNGSMAVLVNEVAMLLASERSK